MSLVTQLRRLLGKDAVLAESAAMEPFARDSRGRYRVNAAWVVRIKRLLDPANLFNPGRLLPHEA